MVRLLYEQSGLSWEVGTAFAWRDVAAADRGRRRQDVSFAAWFVEEIEVTFTWSVITRSVIARSTWIVPAIEVG
jgi:hypothetical protein